MRKGPNESATNFSVGTEKEGNDGNMWVIVPNKNDINRWVKKNSLFVLYSFNNIENWEYKNLPKDWKWVGTGRAIGYPYEKEEQFSGPPDSKKKTHVYLNKLFSNLKKKNVIKKYKIIQNYSPSKKSTQKKKKTRKKTRKIFKKNKITGKTLKYLKKKYNVTTTGNKKEMAEGLWVVRGSSISDDDLQKIIPLLSKRDKKEAEKLLSKRITEPVSNYKGMWKPLPKPLSKMSRKELVKHLRGFRDVWERETTRNQDLSDERLKEESDKDLRELLKFYFSDESKQIAGDWLR